MTATKPGRQPTPLAAFMLGCLVAGALLGPQQQLRSGEPGFGAGPAHPAAYRWHSGAGSTTCRTGRRANRAGHESVFHCRFNSARSGG